MYHIFFIHSSVPFVYFCFCFLCLRRQIQKNIALIYVKDCSAYVFLQEFYSIHLTFRPLIHLEFIFIYGVRECSNFILLHVAVLFSQHHLLKRLSFLHCIFLLASIFDVETSSLSLTIICFKVIYILILVLIAVTTDRHDASRYTFLYILFAPPPTNKKEKKKKVVDALALQILRQAIELKHSIVKKTTWHWCQDKQTNR